MKSKLNGEFFFTLSLAIFVVVCLIDALDFYEKLQGAVFITGWTTLFFIGLLLVGHFYRPLPSVFPAVPIWRSCWVLSSCMDCSRVH